MKHLILLCTAAIAIAGAQPVVKPNGLKIFYHGKILTSNPAQLLIEDGGVAVLGNIIVKVGKPKRLAHVHPYDYFTFPEFGKGAAVVNDSRFIPAPGPSFQDVLNAVQAGARAHPPGTWLMAFIGTQVLEDASVNRLAIDAVATGHPVLLAAC